MICSQPFLQKGTTSTLARINMWNSGEASRQKKNETGNQKTGRREIRQNKEHGNNKKRKETASRGVRTRLRLHPKKREEDSKTEQGRNKHKERTNSEKTRKRKTETKESSERNKKTAESQNQE